MENGPLPKCGSRNSAAYTPLKRSQKFYVLRACLFQDVALALAPRTFGRKHARVSRMEGGWLSKCGSCLSAAHILFKSSQELHGWRAGRFRNAAAYIRLYEQDIHGLRVAPFQNVTLALAPRAHISNIR
eukprot:9501542-Pyramimonas_sp.AAC.1